ncbi:MAG: YdcF family protein [Gammaproteobacteria bacterium]|nr:YdcF family protein [Gammaproteobacteria bacterium]
MEFSIGQIIKSIIFPPGIFIFLIIISLWLLNHNIQAAKRVMKFTALGLYLLSLPIVSELLMTPLESYPALDLATLEKSPAEAIVILSAGRLKYASEYGGGDVAGDNTLARLRYGAKLHQLSHLPILVTGGLSDEKNIPLGQLMAKELLDGFGIQARWQENESKNTAENAKLSHEILLKENITHIFLVTDAGHMSRSVYIFEKQGFIVTPAPTRFKGVNEGTFDFELASFLPRTNALKDSYYAMHEFVGLIWYRVRY